MSFLNAIKKQSEIVTQSRAIETPQDKGLNAHNKLVTEQEKDKPFPPLVSVEIITNRNRIDIYFDHIPSEDLRSDMKAHFWKWNPESRAWYNRDCDASREFLNSRFNLGLTIESKMPETMPTPIIQTLPDTLASASNPHDTLIEEQETITIDADSLFSIYRKQVNELIAELKCDPADLTLLAIDLLHKTTFARDS